MGVAKCRLRLGRARILDLLHFTNTDDDLLMQILTWALVTLTTVLRTAGKARPRCAPAEEFRLVCSAVWSSSTRVT